MLTGLKNAFRIKDLRDKILFTIAMLIVYRIGAHVPVPGVPFQGMAGLLPTDGAMGLLTLFSGGALSYVSVFSLGIMPYITRRCSVTARSIFRTGILCCKGATRFR